MAGSSSLPAADSAAAAIDLLSAHRLGSLLRARRAAAHAAAPIAAWAAGIETNTLADIEAGRMPPTAAVLVDLLKCYGVAPAEFVPPRAPLVTTGFDASGDETLRGHVDAVRKWRKAGRKEKLNFRTDDIVALSETLGTDPDAIERRLIAIGCSPAEARLLRKWFLAALVTIPLAAGLMGTIAPSAAATTRAPSPVSAGASTAATPAQGTVRPGSLTLSVATPKARRHPS
jgi:hypothetical protein